MQCKHIKLFRSNWDEREISNNLIKIIISTNIYEHDQFLLSGLEGKP